MATSGRPHGLAAFRLLDSASIQAGRAAATRDFFFRVDPTEHPLRYCEASTARTWLMSALKLL
jgi:hypothetical protein